MIEPSPFDAAPDLELGTALRNALAMPHDGAFVTRLRALVRQQERGWDDVLAGWFWQGVLAASLAVVLAGWALVGGGATQAAAEESVAVQLLEGQDPGTDVLLASMAGDQ